MSIAEQVQLLRQHVTQEGQPLLAEIIKQAAVYDWRLAGAELVGALEEDGVDPGRLRRLSDQFKASLQRGFTPFSGQENAFNKDLEYWFFMLNGFIDIGRLDGALMVADTLEGVFNPLGKEYCGWRRSRCTVAGHKGDTCTHRFDGDEYMEALICPECDTPRSVCRARALPNGRCHFHNGRGRAYSRMDQFKRAGVYVGQMHSVKLAQLYSQVTDQEEGLSLVPEMNLIATRVADLLEQASQFDVAELRSNLEIVAKELGKSIKEDDQVASAKLIRRGLDMLQNGVDTDRLWRQIDGHINTITRMAEAERRRIQAASESIPVADVQRLHDQTMILVQSSFKRAAARLATELPNHLDQGNYQVARIAEMILFEALEQMVQQRDALQQEAMKIEAQLEDR